MLITSNLYTIEKAMKILSVHNFKLNY